ncbi:MAG: DUF4236 domain-containing protein [Bacteroidales bacterium]
MTKVYILLKMGIRYYRRINLGKGLGLNISKSGLSPSFRTQWGTLGSRGYSVRTGIPGLSYRKYFGRANQQNWGAILLAAIIFIALLYFIILIVWNLGRFVVWATARLYHIIKLKREALRETDHIE